MRAAPAGPRSRSTEVTTKLPAVAQSRRAGSSPPERKAPRRAALEAQSSGSAPRSAPKLPRVGSRPDDSRPPRPTAPAAPLPASSAAVAAPAAATAGPVDLRKCQGVSDELRKVLEEEEVSYNWRRRPKPTAAPEAAPVAAAPVVAPVAAAPVAPVVVARGAGYGSAVSSRQVVPKDEPLLRSLRSPGPTVASGGSLAPKFCSKLELSEDLRAVRLVTYDGSEAMLMAGPLCSAGGPLTKNTRPPEWLLRWIEGRSSSKLFGLAADDWLKAELCMEGGDADVLHGVSLKALLSGLLSDPSGEVLPDLLASPSMAASKALHEVLAAIGEPLEDGSASLLASQVEVALNRLDPAARRGAGCGAPLSSALRREVLRCLWCRQGFEDPSSACDDRWLVQQLQSPPASPSDLRTLRRENDWLDRYLVRLMKLKRTLTKLLETLQQVDHYKVLGISKDASDKELRNAYRKACLRLHPDKGGDKQQFQQLQESYARILEEREQKPRPASRPQSATTTQMSKQLSLEAGEAGTTFSEATELGECMGSFRSCAEEMSALLKDALAAELKIKELKSRDGTSSEAVEALAMAQEAGETLLELSEKIGALAPGLSDALMELAESSLTLAARFSAVPCALLLTEVALSVTLEASRLQHFGKSLLEVRRDTSGTLQTLQQNLSMARILGSVDAETFKLSVGLVRKATSRILQCIREVQKASDDALLRGQQCLAHADSVCRFAHARRSHRGEETDDGGPRELEDAAATSKDASAASTPPAAAPAAAPAPAAPAPAAPAAAPAASTAMDEEQQRRAQNQRLLLQLNGELRELQRRAAKTDALKESPRDKDVSAIISELLWVATDAVLQRCGSADPELLRAALAEEFYFVEVCGGPVAVPMTLAARLLRFGAAGALELLQRTKRRLLEEVGPGCASVLDQHFELLSAAVIAARVS